jgi:hypothetical protein
MKVGITRNHTALEFLVEYYYTLKEDTSLTPNTNMLRNSGRNLWITISNVMFIFSCGSHSIFRGILTSNEWLKNITMNYGWKQCGDNKLFEEQESLGTSYLTKQPQPHCLFADFYFTFKEIWLSATFVIQFLTQRELCFVETLSPRI